MIRLRSPTVPGVKYVRKDSYLMEIGDRGLTAANLDQTRQTDRTWSDDRIEIGDRKTFCSLIWTTQSVHAF